MTDTITGKTKMLARLTCDLVRQDFMPFAIAVLGSSVFVAMLDVYGGERLGDLLGSMAAFVAGGVMNFNALRRLYPDETEMQPRLLRLFGLSLLSSVAMLAGLVLLVLPGIYLYLRWFTAWPVLVRRDAGIVEALRMAWRETSGWEVPVLILIAGAVLIWLVVITSLILCGIDMAEKENLLIACSANFSVYLPLMLSYIAAVACHGLSTASIIDRNEA